MYVYLNMWMVIIFGFPGMILILKRNIINQLRLNLVHMYCTKTKLLFFSRSFLKAKEVCKLNTDCIFIYARISYLNWFDEMTIDLKTHWRSSNGALTIYNISVQLYWQLFWQLPKINRLLHIPTFGYLELESHSSRLSPQELLFPKE